MLRSGFVFRDFCGVGGSCGDGVLDEFGVAFRLFRRFDDVILAVDGDFASRLDGGSVGFQDSGNGDGFAFGIGLQIRDLTFFIAGFGDFCAFAAGQTVDGDLFRDSGCGCDDSEFGRHKKNPFIDVFVLVCQRNQVRC